MNEESLQYRGWRVATASGVGVFFATLFVFTFAVLLRALVKEFEWSREAISSAYGAMTLASAFAAPVMGQLVDQWGPRWIVGPSLMLGAAAFGSLSVLTPHLWHLYLVYLVLVWPFRGPHQSCTRA